MTLEIFDFLKQLTDPSSIITYGGLILLIVVVFAETGLFFGFFLPGDSLLVTAGLLCGTKTFDTHIVTLLLTVSLAAILGNITGYIFGKKVGRALFTRKDSLFFRKEYVILAEKFYEKYGGMALVMGRFLPIIRTFAPILAGVIAMNYARFMWYNFIGCVLWVFGLTLAGYFLGSRIPWVQDYLGYIVIGLIIITSIPIIRTYRKEKKNYKNRNQEK